MDYPSYEKELEVIQLKVPALDLALAAQAANFVQALRRQPLNKVPGLSEAVDWSMALQRTGVTRLSKPDIINTLGCLLKDHHDITRFKQEMLQPLLDKVVDGEIV
jgi:hypothetical protein